MAFTTPVFLTEWGVEGFNPHVPSSTVDTRPYDLLILALSGYYGPQPVSDSHSQTWLTTTYVFQPGGTSVQIAWLYNPITDISHQFWLGDGSNGAFPRGILIGTTGALKSSDPKDQENEAASGGTSLSPGAITPSVGDCLLISAVGTLDATVVTTDMVISGGSYTKLRAYANGYTAAVAVASAIQTAVVPSVNPTWTVSTTTAGLAVVQASFKPVLSAKLRRNTNLVGLGATGPFFQNPLSMRSSYGKALSR